MPMPLAGTGLGGISSSSLPSREKRDSLSSLVPEGLLAPAAAAQPLSELVSPSCSCTTQKHLLSLCCWDTAWERAFPSRMLSLLADPGQEAAVPAALPGQLAEGRTVQAAFTWEHGEPAAVTELRPVFMKDKVCIVSTIRDVREELFSPPLLVLGGKISWFGAAYKSVLGFTLLPSLARGSGCRPQHKLTLSSTTQHQMPFEQLAPEHQGTPGKHRGLRHPTKFQTPRRKCLEQPFPATWDLRLTSTPGTHLAPVTNIALCFLPAMPEEKIRALKLQGLGFT